MKYKIVAFLLISTIFLGGCTSYTNMNVSYDKNITKVEEVEFIDKFEISPVHLAVKGNNYVSVKSLIEKGANVNVVDFMGDTPLIDSVKDKNKTDISKLLLCNGAKKDVKDIYDLSPLDYAKKHKNETIIKMLESIDLTSFCTKTQVINASNNLDSDSDSDGVLNSKDKCPNTPKGDIVDENGCSLKFNLNIHFDFDSSTINNSYNPKIKEFADLMKSFPSIKGKIEAHTDSKGSSLYNQKLSEKRAEVAIKALEAEGINRSRLSPIGYGEMNPKASNETEEGRAQNRRVEASIYK